MTMGVERSVQFLELTDLNNRTERLGFMDTKVSKNNDRSGVGDKDHGLLLCPHLLLLSQ